MYVIDVKAVEQDESMTPKNSLAAIRQLDAYKSARVVAELKIACSKYRQEDLKNKVISFIYCSTPTIPSRVAMCWAKVSDILPSYNPRDYTPKNVETTSPKLTGKLHRKFL